MYVIKWNKYFLVIVIIKVRSQNKEHGRAGAKIK